MARWRAAEFEEEGGGCSGRSGLFVRDRLLMKAIFARTSDGFCWRCKRSAGVDGELVNFCWLMRSGEAGKRGALEGDSGLTVGDSMAAMFQMLRAPVMTKASRHKNPPLVVIGGRMFSAVGDVCWRANKL